MTRNHKLILIGGTSHVGKSTTAARLADDLGWDCLSTDQLARHPGRPWRSDHHPLPADVVDHYALPTEHLVDSVIQHYRANVSPIVSAIVQSRLRNPFDRGLVLEGSAILPDLAVRDDRVNAVWLTASDELLAERIMRNSQYERRTASEQRLIDSFIGRTIAINGMLFDATRANAQRWLDAGSMGLNEIVGSIG